MPSLKLSINIFLSVSLVFILSAGISTQGNLAFPGAEGFGKYSLGGRGGDVIRVTNLNDSGPGSLREAIEAEGPRIVVFDVGGIINLETTLAIWNPYITIAGQTAPGQGICIRGNFIRIRTHDVVIRFLRIRPGDISFGSKNDWGGLDAVGFSPGETEVYNVILDHCSFSWAVDENVGFWGSPYNVTIQNSIISEALHASKHPKGPHSMGILVGDRSNRISIINNLIMHNSMRNPQFSNSGAGDVRNNIIYNPSGHAGMVSNWPDPEQKINFVGNIFIPGPSTWVEHEISVYDPSKYNGKIYIRDNTGFSENSTRNNLLMFGDWQTWESLNEDEVKRFISHTEFDHYVSYTKTKEEMFDFANRYIGASLPGRDNVDRRLIYELNSRTGKKIDSQNEVGGWPGLETGFGYRKNNNSSSKIIPGDWMELYNILPGQENLDFNNNGYTNIEEYLNGTDPRSYTEPGPMAIFDKFSLFNSATDPEFNLNVFPNPFSDYASFIFSIEERSKVIINIYNSVGKLVKRLVNSELFGGDYEFIWMPEWYDNGIFIAVLHVNCINIGSKIIYMQNR